MDQSTLRTRYDQLVVLAKQRNVNWGDKVRELPQEDLGVMVAAIATALGIGVGDAFDETLELEAALAHANPRAEFDESAKIQEHLMKVLQVRT